MAVRWPIFFNIFFPEFPDGQAKLIFDPRFLILLWPNAHVFKRRCMERRPWWQLNALRVGLIVEKVRDRLWLWLPGPRGLRQEFAARAWSFLLEISTQYQFRRFTAICAFRMNMRQIQSEIQYTTTSVVYQARPALHLEEPSHLLESTRAHASFTATFSCCLRRLEPRAD